MSFAAPRASGGRLRRFVSPEIETERTHALAAGHPALAEGRTIFPSTVTPSAMSPRLLVSGVNNPKLGREVTKGPRAGWPIVQLTLEERKTCPRSCEQWAACYGNAMHRARRHAVDADFLGLLEAEVAAHAQRYPGGFLVRLHTLGDFYSVEYVEAWARMLATYPALHVFGFTARRPDDVDPETRAIGRAIHALVRAQWDRFAIRLSGSVSFPDWPGSAVVDAFDRSAPRAVQCPAQTKASEACATCGLCWSAPLREIHFQRHGMKRRARRTA